MPDGWRRKKEKKLKSSTTYGRKNTTHTIYSRNYKRAKFLDATT